MGIFDFFKKKKDDKPKKRKREIGFVEDSFDKPKQPKKEEKHWTDDVFKVEIKDGVIEHVWDNNITDGTFVVPREATKINMFAFKDCKSLETLVLHDCVTYIAPHAFAGCENLKKIVGLDDQCAMKTVGGFSGCKSLERVILPDTTEVIGESAFKNCVNLQGVVIPEGCWAISQHAFENCAALQYLEIPASISIINRWAFDGCHNLTVTFLPNESEEVRMINFDIQGKNYTMPSGDVVIEQGAFNDVKTVCAYDIKTLEKVIASGFRGVVTYFDEEREQTITIDLNMIENLYFDSIKGEDEEEIEIDVGQIADIYRERYGEPSQEELDAEKLDDENELGDEE